jgi:hypothetical protein
MRGIAKQGAALLGAVVLALLALLGRAAPAPGEGVPVARDGPEPAGPVERGLAYLGRHKSDPSALIVLDYLQRKYGLSPDLAFARTYDGKPRNDDLRFWGRLAGLDAPLDERTWASLPARPAIDQVVVGALYCDTFALPPQYGRRLGSFVDQGGYALTHASLALKLLDDNGCALDPADAGDVRERVRRGLWRLVGARARDPRYEELDVRYEALALLLDFHGERSLGDGPATTLLAEQQPDGGWKPAADRPSHPHPTVLAVWALLARAHSDAPAIGFARR